MGHRVEKTMHLCVEKCFSWRRKKEVRQRRERKRKRWRKNEGALGETQRKFWKKEPISLIWTCDVSTYPERKPSAATERKIIFKFSRWNSGAIKNNRICSYLCAFTGLLNESVIILSITYPDNVFHILSTSSNLRLLYGLMWNLEGK